MAIRNIKEIHARILAKQGRPDPSAPAVETRRDRPDVTVETPILPIATQPLRQVTDGATGNLIDRIDEQASPADGSPAGKLPEFRDAEVAPQVPTSDGVEQIRAAEEHPEAMLFLTWEVEIGARIYKIPQAKLASVKDLPHADRLKMFDNLEHAKAEAKAIFERVAAKRKAKGLPKSILEPLMDDLDSWDEKNVPQYFL